MTTILPNPRGAKARATRVHRLRVTVLCIFFLPWIGLPLWMLVVNSFKPMSEANNLGFGLPHHWAIAQNYGTVLHHWSFWSALRNSIAVVVPTMIAVVLLGSIAAWAFARSTSLTMKIVFNISVLSILLPPAVLPILYLLQQIHMSETVPGYVLVMIGTRMGTIIFLATGFLRSFPRDLEEAAAIDGASRIRTYRSVIFPLLRPVLLVGAVILLIAVWNEFFFAIFLLENPGKATLPLALFQNASGSSNVAGDYKWNLVFADVVLTSIPALIVYLFAQKRIVSGLAEGGVKG